MFFMVNGVTTNKLAAIAQGLRASGIDFDVSVFSKSEREALSGGAKIGNVDNGLFAVAKQDLNRNGIHDDVIEEVINSDCIFGGTIVKSNGKYYSGLGPHETLSDGDDNHSICWGDQLPEFLRQNIVSTTEGISEATAANATTTAPVASSTFAGKTEGASIDLCLTPIEEPQNEDQDEDEEPTDKPFVMSFDRLKVTASNTANVNADADADARAKALSLIRSMGSSFDRQSLEFRCPPQAKPNRS
ncbi:MAG: hypothetical protein ACK5A0_12105 [Polaromonas sp.]